MKPRGARAPEREVEVLAGPHAVFEALQAGRRTIRRVLVTRPGHDPRLAEILALAESRRLPIVARSRSELDREVPGGIHQGIAAEVGPFPYAEADDILARVLRPAAPGWMLLLDGIQDPQNLGAIARTAEAAGATGMVVPRDRAAAVTPAVVRASAGATEHLAIAQATNLAAFLATAQSRGVWVAGAAVEGGRNLFAADLTGPVALVIGGEGKGLRPLTRRHCDFLLRIPMRGRVGSLNASAAAAICVYELLRQRLAARLPAGSG